MGLARSMCLSVIAEGVETKEQLERLHQYGCDYVQGYYFAKPMPCEEFEALMCLDDRQLEIQEELPLLDEKGFLVVADEMAAYRNKVHDTFSDKYTVLEAADRETVLALLTRYGNRIAAIILNLSIKTLDGFTILGALQKSKWSGISPSLPQARPMKNWKAERWNWEPQIIRQNPICKADFAREHSMRLS